jgi:hypothetical protein
MIFTGIECMSVIFSNLRVALAPRVPLSFTTHNWLFAFLRRSTNFIRIVHRQP